MGRILANGGGDAEALAKGRIERNAVDDTFFAAEEAFFEEKERAEVTRNSKPAFFSDDDAGLAPQCRGTRSGVR